MTPNEIIEGNRLIGNFMNLWIISSSDTKISEDQHWEDELEYHKSWNELMPVVEKIGDMRVKSTAHYNSDLSFTVWICNGHSKIEGTGHRIFYSSGHEGSMIKATYKAVLQFLHWHNSVKK